MSLKDLISPDKYEKLLSNGLPEKCTNDHYPVVFLSSPTSRRQLLISHTTPLNNAEVYALQYTPGEGVTTGFLNIDELLATDTSLKSIAFDAEMEMSVYEFAAEVEGYITLDYNHLCEAVDLMEIERLRDALNVSS